MSQVDFYVLKEANSEYFACRIVNKAYLQGHKISINTSSNETAKIMNELLWTFHDTSFIPHKIHSANDTNDYPVEICCQNEQKLNNTDLLVNLATDIPEYFDQFKRIIEFVVNNEQARKIAREHYRYYKKNGHDINTHNM